MKRAHIVAGARPNFMKIAPLHKALEGHRSIKSILVHTGQHFTPSMSDDIFADLGLPPPDHHLAATGDTQAKLTASVMVAYENLLLSERPDLVIVVGDVNSTLAACLAAKKLNLPVAHLEAGLRNFDSSLPEEINRLVIDSISDLFWTPSADADENLLREGKHPDTIVRVGNIMIDSFMMLRDKIAARRKADELPLRHGSYVLVTAHRPSNVDSPGTLTPIVDTLRDLARSIDVIFPIHPRTASKLRQFGLLPKLEASGVHLLEPLGYIDFMSLVTNARMVVTDSGGVQEETSFLGIPCLTLRENTERPITLTQGSNRLVTIQTLHQRVEEASRNPPTTKPAIALWDGKAASRVVASLEQYFS